MASPLADRIRAKYPGAYDDLSDTQLEQAITAKYPGVYDDLRAPTVDEEAPGYLGAAWEGLKNLGVGGLEFVGRPAEFVSGTLGGTLRTGSLREGLKQGTAALLEPELVNSQIRESMSKVLEQQAPEFAKNNALLAASLGFIGDVVTDPTNLLGGAGIIRRSAMSGLRGLGASEAVAKRALLGDVGDVFQKGVGAAGRGLTSAAAASPLGGAFPSLRMRTLTAPGRTETTAGFEGLNQLQVRQTLEAAERAKLDAANATVERVFKDLTPDERELLTWAKVYPESQQAAQVAADPRLQQALTANTELYEAVLKTEQAAGIQPLTRSLPVGKDIERELEALSPMDRTMLETYLKQGLDADPAVLNYVRDTRRGIVPQTGETKLQQLARKLNRQIARVDDDLGEYFFADPATLSLTDTGKALVAQATKNYAPTEIPQTPSGVTSTRLRYKLDAEKAKSLTLNEAVRELGAETDAAVLLRNRLLKSARVQGNTDLVRTYAAEFGSATPTKGFRTLTPQTLRGMPNQLGEAFETTYLPNSVADDLERYVVRVMSPDTENGLLGLFQRSTRLWKTMATSLGIPSFYANNFLGNTTNMYAGGEMSPGAVTSGLWNSTRVLARGATDTPTNLLGQVRVGKSTYRTDAELVDLARKAGVIGGQAGSFGVEIGKKAPVGAATLLGAESGPLALLNPDFKPYQKLRDFNQQYIEDPAKLALFVDQLRKGKSVEQASVTVRRVLFDYDELSNTERTIRTYVPFYTWMRKNIPLQLATLAQRPAKLSQQNQFLNAFNEWTRLSGQDPVALSDLPTYLQTGEYTSIPATGTEGSAAMVRARLPWFDVGAVDPTQIGRTMAERISPLIRVPTSLIMGQDLVTGQKLGPDVLKNADFLGRMLPRELGGAVETERGLQQGARSKQITGAIPIPFGSILRGAFPDANDETLGRPLEILLRSLGASPRVLTPEVLEQAYEELKRKAQEEANAARVASLYER